MDGSGTFYVEAQNDYSIEYLGCTLGNGGGGSYYNIASVTATGSTDGDLFNIGTNETGSAQADAYGLVMFLGGDGNFYGQLIDATYGPSKIQILINARKKKMGRYLRKNSLLH